MDKNERVRTLVAQKPYLIWGTNASKVSIEGMIEAVLNYGNWEDYLELEEIMGVSDLAKVFSLLCSRRRVNLRPQTKNYFAKYFERHA